MYTICKRLRTTVFDISNAILLVHLMILRYHKLGVILLQYIAVKFTKKEFKKIKTKQIFKFKQNYIYVHLTIVMYRLDTSIFTLLIKCSQQLKCNYYI